MQLSAEAASPLPRRDRSSLMPEACPKHARTAVNHQASWEFLGPPLSLHTSGCGGPVGRTLGACKGWMAKSRLGQGGNIE